MNGFLLAVVVALLSACSPKPEPPAEETTTAPAPSAPAVATITKTEGTPRFYQHRKSRVTDATDAEQELYQCQWFGEMGFEISGLPPGSYRLVVGNAELSSEDPDYRSFWVVINGQRVGEEINLNRQFGPARKADITLPLEISGGPAKVALQKGRLDSPRLSFLRVLDASGQTLGEWSAMSTSPVDASVAAELDVQPWVLDSKATSPPWVGTYKLRPDSPGLTAADFPGPDGIVYPDWRYAGVPGGIPKITTGVDAADFGAIPDDGQDDLAALDAACRKVAESGGGVVRLQAGTYHLDRPLIIRGNGVVLRGAGRDTTRVEFRYGEPAGGVDFFSPKPGDTLGKQAWIEIHARPEGLKELEIYTNGKQIARQWKQYPQHWGGTFSLRARGQAFADAVGAPGPAELTAVVRYEDGRELRKTIPVVFDPQRAKPNSTPTQLGAITFSGVGRVSPRIALTQDGERGDTKLTLEPGHGLQPGAKIHLSAPATERWKKLTTNLAKWGDYRENQFEILAVAGNEVWINQPLRIEFPVIDGSSVQRIEPITACGVEDLTLEQTKPLWTNGIHFSWGWGCWVKNVHVIKAGRFPIYTIPGKFCEIRDSQATDTWYNGGGGTAYVGWEMSFDCLMENMQTVGMRHAPNVQWAASGNVIRNSVFEGSDGQWHSGWTNENLFENCAIRSGTSDGGYGFGLWASPPESQAHGPNGPRNVVYNCDVTSPKASLWMGGMNENWIIAYNRFVADTGPGVVAKNASFDHIIKGNVFVLHSPLGAAIRLLTADCVGIEVLDNLIQGTKQLSSGRADPLLAQGNVFEPISASLPAKPIKPSIFEWQRKQPTP